MRYTTTIFNPYGRRMGGHREYLADQDDDLSVLSADTRQRPLFTLNYFNHSLD